MPEAPGEHDLSPSLVGRLEAWRSWGDSKVNLADAHDSREVTPAEVAAFEAEGRLLTARVASELPHATVLYERDGPNYG